MRLFLKNLLFTVLVPGTVGVYVPLSMASESASQAGAAWGVARYAAFVPLLAGGAIYLWCLWDFATVGRGTPAPIDAPKHLVVRGLYRYSRNPMYVGVLSVILGWSLWFGSDAILIYGAVFALTFHTFVVVYEEPTLRAAFGDEYERYCDRVGRWLPRLGERGR